MRGGTKTDALWFALGANRTNSHEMTKADKKHAIVLAISTWPERSGRQIAEQIGCEHRYVDQVKAKVGSTTHLPDRVTGKDGKSYPASRATKAKPEPTPTPDPPKFKSRAAIDQRREQMRQMAADGHSAAQIAKAVGMTLEGCRAALRREGIALPADKALGKSHAHNADRILDHIAMDAENLTADVGLVDWASVDPSKLQGWVTALTQARQAVAVLIRTLMKEIEKHGKAA